MATIPYTRPIYDTSQSTARMSDLIRLRGQSEANAIRQQGAISANMWGNVGQAIGGTMADLAKAYADAPRRELEALQVENATRDAEREKALVALQQRTAGLAPMDQADAFANAGFAKEAEAMRAVAQKQIDRSNTQQFGQLVSVYGESNPEEVIRQGMPVAPKETMDWQKQRSDQQKDKATLGLEQAKAVPYVLTVGARLWEEPVRDQADLDRRLAKSKPLADMIGMPELLNDISPTFGPQTAQEQATMLQLMQDQKAPTTAFQVFYAGWAKEHGAPDTEAKSAEFLKAYVDSQQKTTAGDLNDILTTKAREMGTTVDKMPTALKLQIKAQYEATERAPTVGGYAGGMTPAIAADPLKDLTDGERAVVQRLLDYTQVLPTGTAARSPYWLKMIERASLVDPTFDGAQYTVRQGVRKDFTAGKSAFNVRSLNTAVGHLESLAEAGKALNNTDYPVWNAIANQGISAVGDPRVKTFNTSANAVAGELATIFKNTSGTDQEIKSWRELLNAADSPEQIQAVVNQAIELMGSRLGALQSQYETGMGRPKDFQLLNDKSRTILTKLGVDVDQFDPVAAKSSAGAAPSGPGAGNTPAERSSGAVDWSKNPFAPAASPASQSPSLSAPAVSESRSVPSPVAALLAGASTGRHTLSDGSVWDKRADGSVVRVK